MIVLDEKLSDVMPYLDEGEYNDTIAFEYKDRNVLYEFYSHDKGWLGTHKNVHYWCIIEGNIAVGFNENVSVGYSFPIVGKNKVSSFLSLIKQG